MKKRVLSFVLILIMVVALLPTVALANNTVIGSCGENQTWSFNKSSGTLIISGSGDMSNNWGYEFVLDGGLVPWYSYKNSIRTLIVEDGVTSIGNAAFAKCSNLKNVTVAGSVKTIGECAFADCNNIINLTIPNGVKTIKRMAFLSCEDLETIFVPESLKTVETFAFDMCQSLSVVYYGGDSSDRSDITIKGENKSFTNASWKYNKKPGFDDVKSESWYKEYVDYSVKYGIFNGTAARKFSPETNITRAQFVQVLANLSNVDTKNVDVTTNFSDVKSGKWYTPAIKWASDNGIVNGMGNGTFEPEKDITREQMCIMLVNYADFNNITLKNVNSKKKFADDSKIHDWAEDEVYKCQMAGIVEGRDNNVFDPLGTGKRSEATAIFTRFHKEYKDKIK